MQGTNQKQALLSASIINRLSFNLTSPEISTLNRYWNYRTIPLGSGKIENRSQIRLSEKKNETRTFNSVLFPDRMFRPKSSPEEAENAAIRCAVMMMLLVMVGQAGYLLLHDNPKKTTESERLNLRKHCLLGRSFYPFRLLPYTLWIGLVTVHSQAGPTPAPTQPNDLVLVRRRGS